MKSVTVRDLNTNLAEHQKLVYRTELHEAEEEAIITLKKDASLTLIILVPENYQGKFRLMVELFEKAKFQGKVAFALKGKAKLQLEYLARHVGEKSESVFFASGSLDGEAQKNTHMTIEFCKGALDAYGSERDESLLLSDEARNCVAPIILCKEEKVVGKHSMSTGHIEQELADFLAARGHSKGQIKALLAQTMLNKILREKRTEKA